MRLVVQLVEDMVVLGKLGGHVAPEVNGSQVTSFDWHGLIFSIIGTPVEVQDNDSACIGKGVYHIGDQGLILCAKVSEPGKVGGRSFCLDAHPVAGGHGHSEDRLHSSGFDLVEVFEDCIDLRLVNTGNDILGVSPVVGSPALHADPAEQVLGASGAEAVQNSALIIVVELVSAGGPSRGLACSG